MPYDPYETNRIISQTGGLMLGSGNLGVRRKELAMEESLMPDKLAMMKEQTKATQIGSMQRILGLTYQYESRGIPKEVYWPVMQQVMPELKGINVKDIKNTNTGVNILFEHPETKDQLVMYSDPETGLPKVEKFAGYKATIPELAYRATGSSEDPMTKRSRQALKTATKPEIRSTSEGIVTINPRAGEEGIRNTGLKPYQQLPASAVDDVAKLKAIQADIDHVRSSSPENAVGAIKGRIGSVKEKTGIGVNTKEQEARTAVATLKKNLFDIGGKVLTYNELKILEPFIPDVKDPPEVFKIKLDNYEREYQNILNNKLQSFGQSGFSNVQNIESQPVQSQKPKTTSEAVQLLMGTNKMTKEQAIDYIRKNPNAFD